MSCHISFLFFIRYFLLTSLVSPELSKSSWYTSFSVSSSLYFTYSSYIFSPSSTVQYTCNIPCQLCYLVSRDYQYHCHEWRVWFIVIIIFFIFQSGAFNSVWAQSTIPAMYGISQVLIALVVFPQLCLGFEIFFTLMMYSFLRFFLTSRCVVILKNAQVFLMIFFIQTLVIS